MDFESSVTRRGLLQGASATIGGGITSDQLKEIVESDSGSSNISQEKGSWNLVQYDAARTGHVQSDRVSFGSSFEKDWGFKPEDGPVIYLSPVVADETVVAPNRDGPMYAVDSRTGEEKWRVEDVRFGPPAIGDGVVYAGTVYPSIGLYAVDLASGDVLWKKNFGEGYEKPGRAIGTGKRRAPLVQDNTVYYQDSTHVRALNADSGELQWDKRYSDWPPTRYAGPAFADGKVFVSGRGISDSPDVKAVDSSTGETVWTYSTEINDDNSLHGGPSGITVRGSAAYFGAQWGGIYALDIETGEELWRSGSASIYASPAVTESTVFVGYSPTKSSEYSGDGLIAYDRKTGDEVWKTDLSGDRSGQGIRGGPIVVGDTVFILARANLYAVDRNNEDIKSEISTGGNDVSSPAVVDGTIYVGGGGIDAIIESGSGRSDEDGGSSDRSDTQRNQDSNDDSGSGRSGSTGTAAGVLGAVVLFFLLLLLVFYIRNSEEEEEEENKRS